MNIELERVPPHQAEVLQALARSTFIETFAANNSPENLNAYLEKAYNHEQLSAELSDPGIEYWFGMQAEKPIGFLMLKLDAAYEKLEGPATEIQRIYVVKEHLGSGAGKALFDFGVKRAEEIGSRWLWLGVWKSNHRAVRFYQKQGMEIVGDQIFPMGDDPQEDWVMARRVK
jgi:ribosomal protein S18 acetylase RimI-like enzyme